MDVQRNHIKRTLLDHMSTDNPFQLQTIRLERPCQKIPMIDKSLISDHQTTTTNHRTLATDQQPSNVDHQPPTTEHWLLNRNHRTRTTNHRTWPPTSTHQTLTTNHQPSNTDHRPSKADHQPPTIEQRPPTTNHRTLTINHSPLTTDHRLVTTDGPRNNLIEVSLWKFSSKKSFGYAQHAYDVCKCSFANTPLICSQEILLHYLKFAHSGLATHGSIKVAVIYHIWMYYRVTHRNI